MTRDLSNDVLFITLDSCRFDTFLTCLRSGRLPNLSAIAPLHKAHAPSHFTYGSHAAFWVGFTPGVAGSSLPWINPKVSKIFRMSFSGRRSIHTDLFTLEGQNIVEGFNRLGYNTFGSGSVDWFDPASDTGALLGASFEHFFFSGNTWSLNRQLLWLETIMSKTSSDTPRFVFLNIGETHVPYWFEGAPWPQRPSPCQAFGGSFCDAKESSRRQAACLEWVDRQLSSLLSNFLNGTILICADHGDCWGEDSLWEHGISHPMTLTVPLLLRARGVPVGS